MTTPPPESSRERSALDWPLHTGLGATVRREVEAQVHRRRRFRARGAVATLAVLCILGAGWHFSKSQRPIAHMAASATVSVPAREMLPDGTVVELNQGSAIRADFSGPLRRVSLMRGEAHFTVAKDLSRPFVVTAGRVAVRAVGTAFAVHQSASSVDVLVTEGRVAIEEATAATNRPEAGEGRTLVDAGHGATVPLVVNSAAGLPIVALSPAALAGRLSWRVPRLEFTDTPLAEALALFNQHSRVRLTLGDPSLGGLRVSGIVRADNTAALVQLLQTDFGLVATPQGADEIRLARSK